MLEFKEYPIVDKFVTHQNKKYSISVSVQDFVQEDQRGRSLEVCHILSAANYETGKELRLAIWNTGKYPNISTSYETTYSQVQKYDVQLAVESRDQVWNGWPTLTAKLDVRVLRFRLDDSEDDERRAVWKKHRMIADMLYLYMYPEGAGFFPLSVTMFDDVQSRVLKYEHERQWFLHNPDLFSFNPNIP